MSSVSLTHPTNEAFADIKEEIDAEAAADPTKKKLGVLFWICVGWIVLVALGGHLRQPAPAAQPRPRATTTACRTPDRAGATSSAPTTSTGTSSAA